MNHIIACMPCLKSQPSIWSSKWWASDGNTMWYTSLSQQSVCSYAFLTDSLILSQKVIRKLVKMLRT
jgi:hypothetical protein